MLIGAINAATDGRGEAVLLTGEAGVGKTRLLIEARREAERRGVQVLRGRAVESGGAYRPLVDAFARASAPFANDAALARLRPHWRGFCPAGLPMSGSWHRWRIPLPYLRRR